MELIAKSKNGLEVFYDPIHSHAATHLEDTPQLKGLVQELIGSLELQESEIARHYDMGRIVGTCDVVNTDATDEIVYGIRKNRDEDGHVPFTKSRQGDPCAYVSLHLIKQQDGRYILSSCWIGKFGEDDEPFPNSPLATPRSADFWDKHAFVWGSQEIQPGSLQTNKPW